MGYGIFYWWVTQRLTSMIENIDRKEQDEPLILDTESFHDNAIKICDKCDKLCTHFCKTCNENLCKLCIVDYYKNKNFTKNHEMVPI